MRLREVGGVSQRQDRGSRLVIVVSIAVAIGVGSRIASSTTFHIPGSAGLHLLVGALFVISGSSLRLWCMHTLGRYFRSTVMTQEGQSAVEIGPYRFIRHPSYTGALLDLVGVGIAFGNWLGILVTVVIGAIGFAVRIWVEEKALVESLGDEYVTYMKRTKRLIPFVL